MHDVIVSGGFDDIGSRHLRFLHEASRLGRLTVLLWDDPVALALTGFRPRFGIDERRYFLESLRWVDSVRVADSWPTGPDCLPDPDPTAGFHLGRSRTRALRGRLARRPRGQWRH